MKKHYVAFVSLLLAWNAVAAPLKVVTSFSILEDLTREIGGAEIETASLIARGNDPHDFAPSARDLERLKNADAVFFVGLGFEPWMDAAVKAARPRATPVLTAAKAESIEKDGRTDPHVWLDFENARRMSLAIESTLASLRPTQKEAFAARGTAFRAALTKKEEAFRKDFAALPTDHRAIVSAHEGFAYLGRTFGVELLHPTYVGHEHELSPKALSTFLRGVRERKLKSYFVVYGHPSAITPNLARDYGLRLAGTLYGDTLGPAAGEAGTYLKMQEHNLRAILDHLRNPAQN